ncbi:hypothetical protein EmuJ_000342500 [Echinococcus multilocularis]|uniref:Uncharacterized protein n=1 Tax=Echinococcus multilocularis TaxID=6211 RepID=A0A068Y1M7_ECHMU|nr:hypothetical protein EmuJ_000342500 [Echinococcus multilocularis]
MTTQRHLKPSVSESYGEGEVGAGGLSGFSEPSSPQMVGAMVKPTPLNSVVITDTVLAHLISINASPQTICRLLEDAQSALVGKVCSSNILT